MTRLAVLAVDVVPKVAARLGVLASVEVLAGDIFGADEYVDEATGERWTLTSIAFVDPPPPPGRYSVGLRPASIGATLQEGTRLRQIESGKS